MTQQSEEKTYLGSFPMDLVLIGLLGLWTVGAAFEVFGTFPGRALVGMVVVLFAPGYALVSVLFPNKHGQKVHSMIETSNISRFKNSRAEVTEEGRQVTVIERVLLAVVLSLCLVPLLGFGLEFAQLEIQTSSFLGAVGVTTVSLTIVAMIRRQRALPGERFNPHLVRFVWSVPSQVKSGQLSSNLSVVLIIGFVVAGAGMGAAVLDAEQGEDFTEFSLLTEDPETGELVADEYPEEITQDETEGVYVSITNNEGNAVEYSVVTVLQSFDNEGQLRETERLDVMTTTVDHGETWQQEHTVNPETTGENLRLTYLLYVNSPPDETPRTENAYRHLHIWVDVPSSTENS